MQVKLIVGTDYQDLENQINESVKSKEDPKVDVDFKHIAAVVTYTEKSARALCCDCSKFDPDEDTSSVMGLCHACGKRVRFNKRACNDFSDERGVTK